VIELQTDTPSRVTLAIADGRSTRSVRFPDYALMHKLQLLGLRPNTAYTIETRLEGETGSTATLPDRLSVVTDPLPDDFPILNINASLPTRMESGFTLLDRFTRGAGESKGLGRYMMILDPEGHVVWYSTRGGGGTQRLENGNLLFRERNDNHLVNQLIEMTLTGETIRDLPLADPGKGLHHELYPSAAGTLFSVTRATIKVTDYPVDYDDVNETETLDVRDDRVVEFNHDGALLREWRLSEMLDPRRIGYYSLIESATGRDWAHTNSVVEDPRDGSLVISIRHQSAVVKFAPDTGQLKWILSSHDNWPPHLQQYLLTPVGGEFEWPSQQHAAQYTREGTLILFDNGNVRTRPFSGVPYDHSTPRYSRAVEYAIDEDTMEVRQVWQFGPEAGRTVYADFYSDADPLPETGNALITYGAVSRIDNIRVSESGFGRVMTKVLEVTRDVRKDIVFEVDLVSREPGGSIRVYRSARIPGLYDETVVDSLVP